MSKHDEAVACYSGFDAGGPFIRLRYADTASFKAGVDKFRHLPLDATPAQPDTGDVAALREALKLALREICQREARTEEILEFVQAETGTGWTCDNCGHSTYHAGGNECADCGTEFPFANMLAFKLHATGTEDEQAIDEVWEARQFDEMIAALSKPNAPGAPEDGGA